MLTCTDDTTEWASDDRWRCCMCGSTNGIAHCPECGHDFCRSCRSKWFSRGIEALKTMLGHTNLHCGGARHE